MTKATTNSLDKQNASAALASLDDWLATRLQATSPKISTHFQGPFGILDLSINNSTQDDQPRQMMDQEGHSKQNHDLFWSGRGGTPASETDHHAQRALADTSSFDENATNLTSPLGVDFATDTPFSDRNSSNEITAPSLLPKVMTPFFFGISENQSRFPPVPAKAPELLRYHADYHVSPLLSLRGVRNCPWQTRQLPSAKKTYAELLLCQPVNHASLSLFFSLLAVSSRHLAAQDDRSENWEKLCDSYEQTARQHLDFALKEEATGEIRVKYKELLMALLSIVVIEVSAHVTPYDQQPRLMSTIDISWAALQGPEPSG